MLKTERPVKCHLMPICASESPRFEVIVSEKLLRCTQDIQEHMFCVFFLMSFPNKLGTNPSQRQTVDANKMEHILPVVANMLAGR